MTRPGVYQSYWTENFDFVPTLWFATAGSGTESIAAIGGVGDNNNVYQAAGYRWRAYTQNIKFDPTVLYRVKIRARRTATTDAAKQLLWCGVEGVAEDGVTLVNVNGANSHFLQHYFAAAGFDLAAIPLNEWREFVGYFRGWAAVGSGGSPDQYNPGKLNSLVRYFRPLFVVNYDTGPAGNVTQVDNITVEALPSPPVGAPIPFGPNLLEDPGFEGTGAAWIDGGGFFFEAGGGNQRSGSRVCRWQTFNAGGPNLIPTIPVSARPGDRFYLASWQKTASGTGTVQLAVRWRRADGTQISREVVATITGPVAAYTKMEGLTSPAPAETVFAAFDWGENTSDNSATPWYLDDFEQRLSLPDDRQVEFVHLIEANYSGGSLYLNTGATDLKWDGRTWEAIGGLLTFEGVQESGQEGRSSGVQFQLSGVDQTIVAVLLSNSFRGRPLRVWRAYLDSVRGAVQDVPLLLFEGWQLAPYEVTESFDRTGGTVVIKMQAIGHLGVDKIRGIMSNVTSHGHIFPGDTFFQNAAALANLRVFWGTQAPTAIGGGNGGNNGGTGRGEQQGDDPTREM